MKKNINQSLAVGASLVVVALLLFGNQIMNLFQDTPAADANANSSVVANLDTGVKKQDLVVGTGATASAGDTVTVHYVGMLTDGKVFDSSKDRGQPFVFKLGDGSVIRGWDVGVAGMKVGGTRRLIIAPDYGYGDRAVGPIPAGSTLVFDVELLGVQKPQ